METDPGPQVFREQEGYKLMGISLSVGTTHSVVCVDVTCLLRVIETQLPVFMSGLWDSCYVGAALMKHNLDDGLAVTVSPERFQW